MRREQLLSTALALFAEHGYAATSTRRIAEVAGVTEGLVFHYFASKEALLLELMARRNTFAGRVLVVLQQSAGGTALALLRAIAAGFADVSAEEATLIRFVNAEAHVNAALRGPLAAGTALVLERIVAVLTARVAAGELRAGASLEAAALGFFGGFSFYFAQHRDVGTERWRRDAAAFAEAWAEQCWRGVASDRSLSNYSRSAKGSPQ